MSEADIGLIGLAVMGQNLVLNMNDHGYRVAVFNRTASKVDEFLSTSAKGSRVLGSYSLQEFFSKLKKPHKILLMVKAGAPVDSLIESLEPHLSSGDILIDGGNSHFADSSRRCQRLKEKGILFVGAGISGGEEGARHGPSIMPGGNEGAWPTLKPIFQKIAARTKNNLPCCEWVGKEGSGHFVKMVHNGIEYGDMQLICEAYDLMHRGLGLSNEELHEIFKEWNEQELDSYLIEITSQIFGYKDDQQDAVIDKILDVAGQKGTGKWVATHSLELGYPLPLIAEAVYARYLSSLKEERVFASQELQGPSHTNFEGNREEFIHSVKQALYASKIISYAQGFGLIQQASQQYHWGVNFEDLSTIWQGGCIIRSSFLEMIKTAYQKDPNLKNLLLDDFFKAQIQKAQASWRKTICKAIELGIPTPCFSSALAYYDSYRSHRLPANLLQAQRDFFGAHTYERVDQPRGDFFHSDWTGTGGLVSSSQYIA